MGRAKTMKFNDYKDFKRSLNRGGSSKACGKTCGKTGISTEVADAKADLLVNMFHAPQCRLFFLKCVYHLPEATIQRAIESSMRPEIQSHIRYFTVVAKRELELVGY